jgi:hypothetical protein
VWSPWATTLHDVDYNGDDCAGIIASGSATGDRFYDNTIEDSGRSAINLNGLKDSEIDNNVIYDAVLLTTDDAAIYGASILNSGDRIDHNIISDSVNQYGGNPVQGIYLDNNSYGFTLDHNVLYNDGQGLGENSPSGVNNLYNNTFGPSLGSNVSIGGSSGELDGSYSENNIFTGSENLASKGATTATNIDVPTNPDFVDPAGPNYQLQSSSPAINAGTVVAPYTNGYSGSAPDIGAYESGQAAWTAGSSLSSTSVIPIAPSDLAIAQAAASTFVLTWKDNSSNETGFVISRALLGTRPQSAVWSDIATVGPNVTTYTDIPYVAGQYAYRVRAVNGYIDSQSSYNRKSWMAGV